MIEKKVMINLSHGLHARPATTFVNIATSFSSDIKIVKNGKSVNGKSIMGVMSLAISKGEEIILTADGDDAAEAVDSLEKVLIQTEE